MSASEPIELSRIYPTPPSVENNEGEKFEDVKMARIDGSDQLVSGLLWENVSLQKIDVYKLSVMVTAISRSPTLIAAKVSRSQNGL